MAKVSLLLLNKLWLMVQKRLYISLCQGKFSIMRCTPSSEKMSQWTPSVVCCNDDKLVLHYFSNKLALQYFNNDKLALQYFNNDKLALHFCNNDKLASSQRGLEHALGRFAVACDQAGMKISTKINELLCLSRNEVSVCCKWQGLYCSRWRSSSTLRWNSRVTEGWTVIIVVTKRVLSDTTKEAVFKAVFTPILTYGH